MKRSERSEIYQKITNVLKKGEYNTQQIAEQTGIRWETVKNALVTLEASQFVTKKENKYALKTPELNENTILGIPIEKEQAELENQIAKRIKELSKKDLGNTFIQKILIEVIKKNKLNIPYGLYLFGECTLLKLNNIDNSNSITKYDVTIKETLQEYEPLEDTAELMLSNYLKNNFRLHLSRLKLDNNFREKFTQTSLKSISSELKEIIFNFDGDEDIKEILDYFYSTYVQLLKINQEELETLRLDIYFTFKTVWELIGTNCLYQSIKNSTTDIKPYYNLRKSVIKELAETYISNLASYIPEVKIDPELRRFKGIAVRQSQ